MVTLLDDKVKANKGSSFRHSYIQDAAPQLYTKLKALREKIEAQKEAKDWCTRRCPTRRKAKDDGSFAKAVNALAEAVRSDPMVSLDNVSLVAPLRSCLCRYYPKLFVPSKSVIFLRFSRRYFSLASKWGLCLW